MAACPEVFGFLFRPAAALQPCACRRIKVRSTTPPIRGLRNEQAIEGLVLDPTAILLLVFLTGTKPSKEACDGKDSR